jgi:hypothetical protein
VALTIPKLHTEDTVSELEMWAHVATIVGGISIPISGIFILYQLWRQTELARAASAQSLVELSSPFNLQLIQDEKMARCWVQGAKAYESEKDDVAKYRYRSLITWWLILHENIFFQRKKRQMDKSIYEAWHADLRRFLEDQCPPSIWNDIQGSYQEDFQNEVKRVHADIRAAREKKEQQETQDKAGTGSPDAEETPAALPSAQDVQTPTNDNQAS